MKKASASLWIGILLTVVGLWMLADRLGYLEFDWYHAYPVVILFLGLIFVVRLVGAGDRSALFPAVTLTLIGLFFVLRNYNLMIYTYADEYWALLVAILGVGFVAEFFASPTSWGLLILGLILVFFGVAVFGDRIGYWDGQEMLRYWPALLVLLGLVLVFRDLWGAHENRENSTGGPE